MPEKPQQYFEVLNIAIHMQIMVKIVFVKLNFQKNRGEEIGKKKAGQFSRMFCLYIISYITDQPYYTDMNWRYNTLLLSTCKGS